MIQIKRYAAFTGEHHYPFGGWDDFAGLFDTAEDAMASIPTDKFNAELWAEVVDLLTEKTVFRVEEGIRHGAFQGHPRTYPTGTYSWQPVAITATDD